MSQAIGNNIKAEVKGNVLHLQIDLTKELGMSKSGKNMLVAGTGGNVLIPGSDVKIGINAYKAPKFDA